MNPNEPKTPAPAAPAARAAPPELAPPDDAGSRCDACKGRGWVASDDVPRAVCGTCNGTGYPHSWAAQEIDRLDRETTRLHAESAKLREERDRAEERRAWADERRLSAEKDAISLRQAADRLRERVGALAREWSAQAKGWNLSRRVGMLTCARDLRAALRAESPQDDTAVYYLADGSEVRLPREEVERRRKAAAKVIGAARDLVRERRRTGGAGGHDLRALAEALDALGEDAGKWSDVAAGLLACVSGPAAPTPTTPPLAPWYAEDGSTVMLPAPEVERRRKLAAKVIAAARKVHAVTGYVDLQEPLDALDAVLAAPSPEAKPPAPEPLAVVNAECSKCRTIVPTSNWPDHADRCQRTPVPCRFCGGLDGKHDREADCPYNGLFEPDTEAAPPDLVACSECVGLVNGVCEAAGNEVAEPDRPFPRDACGHYHPGAEAKPPTPCAYCAKRPATHTAKHGAKNLRPACDECDPGAEAKPPATPEPVRKDRCSICGSPRVPLTRDGRLFGACTLIGCKDPLHDVNAEEAEAKPPATTRDRSHAWGETSDPWTPMCSACGVLDGDQRADKPCPAAPAPADPATPGKSKP